MKNKTNYERSFTENNQEEKFEGFKVYETSQNKI
jgi:hypothetical protein